MKTRSNLRLLLSSLALVFAPPAVAAVIHFDELDASVGDIALADRGIYEQLRWSNISVYTKSAGMPGLDRGIVSEANAAYGGGDGRVGSIRSSRLFDFDSAAIGSAYYDNLLVTVTGSRDGAVLFTQQVLVGTGGADLVDFGFEDIDTLSFSARVIESTLNPFDNCWPLCTQFTLDDLALDIGPVLPVPAPPTMGLLLLGALAAATMRKGSHA